MHILTFKKGTPVYLDEGLPFLLADDMVLSYAPDPPPQAQPAAEAGVSATPPPIPPGGVTGQVRVSA